MTTEELYQHAKFGKNHPEKASGGQRAAGQILSALESIDWQDALYYFSAEEIADLLKLISANPPQSER